MWPTIRAGVLTASIFFVGCDKNSDSASTAPPPQPAAPTTQDLEHGTWKTLNLKYDPITMNVPDSWNVTSLGGGSEVIIEGSTPRSSVAISLPIYHSVRTLQEKVLEDDARKAAKADAAIDPDLIKGDVVRVLGNGATVIEELTLDGPASLPAATAPAAPVAIALPPAATQHAAMTPASLTTVQWIFSICVPDDATHFKVYELRYHGLTLHTFKADQAFLRRIMDSIAYVPEPK